MTDFKTQIQAFTCIGDEAKQKILDISCSNLDPEKQQEIIKILTEGETKKKTLEKDHNKATLEGVQEFLSKVKDFKRGPLKEAYKETEKADHGADEATAEDLLKDL
ncbi:MAG: hypothetical protein ACD_50C00380G0001 [uncultured bacterium]|nr:MAG: hypothetical protein ACD_50C00380G0001 [uncultured bacterium]